MVNDYKLLSSIYIIIYILPGVPAATRDLGPCPLPDNFPPSLDLKVEFYTNFDLEIQVPFAYVSIPKTEAEVVTLANWAYQNGYRVRTKGSSHSWPPYQFTFEDNGIPCPKTILASTSPHFTFMYLNPTDDLRPDLHSVTVGSGVKLVTLLEFLESHDLGLYACPAIGEVTVGGMLAIGAHGSGVPSKFDGKSTGHAYGSISNLVMDMKIVAWNNETKAYHIKTQHRKDKDCKAFLTNLGRTFVTSVTFRVGKNQNLRSQSHFYVLQSELFAHPVEVTDTTRTLNKFVDGYGRLEAAGFPMGGEAVWVITWKNEPIKPLGSKAVFRPYNYGVFNLLMFVGAMWEPILRVVLQSFPSLIRAVGPLGVPLLQVGISAVRSEDYWGPSKNHLLFYPPHFSTRVTPSGITVLTSRANLQMVISIIKAHHDKLSRELNGRQKFPNFLDFEVRMVGVDNPEETEIPGAEPPLLSPSSRHPNYPEYDITIFMEDTGFPGMEGRNEFHTRWEDSVLKDIDGKYGIIRPEWSKAWAYTRDGPWTNQTFMKYVFPRSFSTSDKMEEWNWAVNTLDQYDPHRIFSNAFLDKLMVAAEDDLNVI